jgi:hypothetical protein
VHRDIERREPLGLDAAQLGLSEVGQRDVVAVQEREPEVVVLDVQAASQALGQLMDEAEHALVGAGSDIARAGRLELHTQLAVAADQLQRGSRLRALDGQP